MEIKNPEDNEGITPLDMANENDHKEIAELFQDHIGRKKRKKDQDLPNC